MEGFGRVKGLVIKQGVSPALEEVEEVTFSLLPALLPHHEAVKPARLLPPQQLP
jgi:hypothetical protein